MAKIEQILHGKHIIVERLIENAGIPHSDTYRISTFNQWNHYHDEITLTEEQWAELKRYMLEGADGVIAKPFHEKEMEDEFKPRFGGANPKYRDFYRAGWNAAFEYVNAQLLKQKHQNYEWW